MTNLEDSIREILTRNAGRLPERVDAEVAAILLLVRGERGKIEQNYKRGKTNGAVLALDELKRDVLTVAHKYDDDTNTIWIGNINRIRTRILNEPEDTRKDG